MTGIDQGWDYPQSGSGAGGNDDESSFALDSAWNEWSPYDGFNVHDHNSENSSRNITMIGANCKHY